MNFLCMSISLLSVALSTLALDPYYAVPIEQYVRSSYEPGPNIDENEILDSSESSYPQYLAAVAEDDPTEEDSENGAGSQMNQPKGVGLLTPASSSDPDASEILQPAESRIFYRPYLRFRQISSRRNRVPIRRRYDVFSGYPSMSEDSNQRDRFPTVI